MYISPLKTIIVEGLRETFDDLYPNAYFRNVNVELDYPVENQEYPAIFVSYDDASPLRRAGISMVEYKSPTTGNEVLPFARWHFQGNISITVVSIATALERDELYDQVVGVIAFGREDPTLIGRFHTYVDGNDLIASTLQTDIINPMAASAAPGTPWGTDEMMFERTLSLEIVGEFVPDMANGELVKISRIIVTPEEEIPDEIFLQAPIYIPRSI